MQLVAGLAIVMSGLDLPDLRPSRRPRPKACDQSQPAPVPAYSYDSANRRDPFISPLSRGSDPRASTRSSGGLHGLATDDITVKGIVMSRDGYVAMIQAPDQRTYIVRQNDQLLDGRVKTVTAAEVVVTQEVNDPLSLVKQRDVRKSLRATDQGQ